MENVVFRTDYDPYMNMEKYLAVFPNDPCNTGRVAYMGFWFDEYGRTLFEPYGEMSLDYYYNSTKVVHRNTDVAQKCLKTIEGYYGMMFDVREKIK